MTAPLPKKVFCIGLAGVGVSAVAKLYLAQGSKVSGSDPKHNPLVDDLVKQGVTYYPHEDPQLITPDCDVVIYTDDTAPAHPMRRRATELGIHSENFSVSLGKLMAARKQRICVAGTNGKSTTTALTGLLLGGAGLDPTVFVGSRVPEFNGNLRLGSGSVFVAEADEYRDHYLNYSPTIISLTNIEPDHLDYFRTEAKMMNSFRSFVSRLPVDGVLVANADDSRVTNISAQAPHVVTFGRHHAADLQASDIVQSAGQQSWTTTWRGQTLGRFTLPLPGEFNIMNSLSAMAGALAGGADPTSFRTTIAGFNGVWRRFQILNPSSTTTIISDYAHHPTAVQVTLEGAEKFYPGRRIVAVFQPHHRSRLTTLFDDFTKSFGAADDVMIVETYTVPGRDVPESESKSSAELVDALKPQHTAVSYASSPSDAQTKLQDLLQPGDVAIIMGAGDIWETAERLGKHYA